MNQLIQKYKIIEKMIKWFSIGSSGNNLLRNVKINGKLVLVQLDSGSEASIIPKNLWQNLGEPKLRPTNMRLKQFDGTQIKTMGQFEAIVEMEDKYAIGNIVVAECLKKHGLLGTDILKVDFSKMSINKDCYTHSIGCLKN